MEKIQVSLKLYKNNGHFTRRPVQLLFVSHSVLLRIRNVSDKHGRESRIAHFVFSNFFPLENHAVCEIMWKNIIELYRLQMTILRMCIALWVAHHHNVPEGLDVFPVP